MHTSLESQHALILQDFVFRKSPLVDEIWWLLYMARTSVTTDFGRWPELIDLIENGPTSIAHNCFTRRDEDIAIIFMLTSDRKVSKNELKNCCCRVFFKILFKYVLLLKRYSHSKLFILWYYLNIQHLQIGAGIIFWLTSTPLVIFREIH